MSFKVFFVWQSLLYLVMVPYTCIGFHLTKVHFTRDKEMMQLHIEGILSALRNFGELLSIMQWDSCYDVILSYLVLE